MTHALRWLARAALAVYVAALATATHWPHLRVNPAQGVFPLAGDKLLHAAAYAGLVVLLLAARVLPGQRSMCLIVAAGVIGLLAVADEMTQSFVPGRTFSWVDAAASIGGGLAVLAAAATGGAVLVKRRRNRANAPPPP